MKIYTKYFIYNNIITQPILSYIFYYNEHTREGDELNVALWDKIIERKTAIKAANFIGEDYYHQKIKIENDIILLFSLFRTAETYQYVNEIGYIYIQTHGDSITHNWKYQDPNSIIHGIFLNIKFLYEKTGNSHLEKSFCVFKLKQAFIKYKIFFSKAKKEYSFMKSIFQLFLLSPYILFKDKIYIYRLQNKILKCN